MEGRARDLEVRVVVGYIYDEVTIKTNGASYVHTKSEGLHKERSILRDRERGRERGGAKRHLTKYTERENGKKRHE